MPISVAILPLAAQDVRTVHDWYEKQKLDLGKEFTAAVLQELEELQKTIIVHRIFFANVQYVQLKRFPYTIFFFTDGNSGNLVNIAVLGNKQDQLSILKKRR